MKILCLLLLCMLMTPAFAGTAKDKKLIEYGWDCPTTAYAKANIEQMEKAPFDGVVIQVISPRSEQIGGSSLGWQVFSRIRFEDQDIEQPIADLKETNFKRFKHNFIQVISMPGDVDWFEDDWSIAAHNAGMLARVAKQGGCVGIMFDPEEYGKYAIWTYQNLPAELKSKHTYEEYAEKVRKRGREFITAINKEFPDITILGLFGPSLTYLSQQKAPIAGVGCSLLAPFYDGVCEAATPGTTIVDGYEMSYGFRTRDKFEEARRFIYDSVNISRNPDAFRKHIRAGFGVWADNQSGALGWHPGDSSKNYFSPEGFRASVNYALENCDGYVWIYSERFWWWNETAPKDFMEALLLAKEGPGPGQQELPNLKRPSTDPKEHEAAFDEFRKTMTQLVTLPRDGWKFSRDQSDIGEENGWFKLDFDDSAWRKMHVGYSWEDLGESYDGIGWYRLRFKAPAVPEGKKVFIVFGAADDAAWVWLNGESVGSHDIGLDGWNVPFALEIKDTLKPEAENTLAVKVLDREQWGGLWRPVKLMVK